MIMPVDKKLTISDIARQAGVAKVTVSRVINNSPKVTARTRDKVLSTMARLNFVPDVRARGLATNRTYLLGLVYYESANALYISDIQRGALAGALAGGYELIMHPLQDIHGSVTADVERFVERTKVDGVILVPPISQSDEVVNMLVEKAVGVMRMTARQIDLPERTVISQDRIGAALMTNYLIDLNHLDIAFIRGPEGNISAQEKYEGFCSAMKERGLRVKKRLIVRGNYSLRSGYDSAIRLISRSSPPSAVFAANDYMALGVLRAALARGVAVPSQLSVAGFDDSSMCGLVWPSLTSVHQSLDEVGRQAAQKLIDTISGVPLTSEEYIEPAIAIRDSTGPRPSN